MTVFTNEQFDYMYIHGTCHANEKCSCSFNNKVLRLKYAQSLALLGAKAKKNCNPHIKQNVNKTISRINEQLMFKTRVSKQTSGGAMLTECKMFPR